ncbi:MAG: Rieske (2Fe-2S) protein, partial [Methanobacterium sp.]
MSFVEIAATNELVDGNKKMVKFNDHELMLARVGDNYYCSDNRCPHMGGNLSQ